MVAIVTDVHYRMALALIRDLGQAGVDVICCESDRFRGRASSPALGALSRYCSRHVWLSEEDYAQSLLDLCREVGKEYHCRPALLPVGAATLSLIAADRPRFDEVCGLLIPTSEQLALFNSKEQVAELAKKYNIPTPEGFVRKDEESVQDFAGRLQYPCVIKPVCGEKLGLSAAQRYAFADTPEDAATAFLKFLELAGEDPVVQRRLMGGGLGLSVLAKEGKIIRSLCHRRVREYPVSGGPSSCCKTEVRKDLLAWVDTLVRETGFSGLAMFEFKEDHEGRPYLLEVNPRIWGTFPLTRVSKSGIPYLWYCHAFQRGNPSKAITIPVKKTLGTCKMIFGASDLLAAAGYLRRGQIRKTLGAFVDALNPAVRDGVFEWKDPVPGFAYFRSLLAKERNR